MKKKFRVKPPVFTAVQYDGKNSDELKTLFEEEDGVSSAWTATFC